MSVIRNAGLADHLSFTAGKLGLYERALHRHQLHPYALYSLFKQQKSRTISLCKDLVNQDIVRCRGFIRSVIASAQFDNCHNAHPEARDSDHTRTPRKHAREEQFYAVEPKEISIECLDRCMRSHHYYSS